MGRIDGASERDRTSDLLITNQLLGHGLHVTSKMLMALTVCVFRGIPAGYSDGKRPPFRAKPATRSDGKAATFRPVVGKVAGMARKITE